MKLRYVEREVEGGGTVGVYCEFSGRLKQVPVTEKVLQIHVTNNIWQDVPTVEESDESYRDRQRASK